MRGREKACSRKVSRVRLQRRSKLEGRRQGLGDGVKGDQVWKEGMREVTEGEGEAEGRPPAAKRRQIWGPQQLP